MRTIRTNFQTIKLNARKLGLCLVCGQKCTRTATFSQTLNPFNKNKQGIPKHTPEILAELRERIEQWKKEPVAHARCEELDAMPGTSQKGCEA